MKALPLFLLFLSLSACSRVANMGQEPDITPPRQSTEFMAMTEPPLLLPPSTGRPEAAASLWTAQPASLVADRRATMRGDILTVVIEINDQATIQNSSGRSRRASDKVSIPAMATAIGTAAAARAPRARTSRTSATMPAATGWV